jgi:MerR family transcriptional regulator, light-induced transcriptional regulator
VPATPHADLDGLRADYLAALLARDSHHARVVIERALAGGANPAAVDLQVLAPTLRELGDRWERGELTVAEEHLVSEAVRSRLGHLLADSGGGVRGSAVLACAPGEQHELGLMMLAIALRRDGWKIVYLGADTPVDAALDLAHAQSARVVAISVATQERAEALRNSEPQIGDIPLVIGGSAASPELAASLGARYAEGTRLADAVTAMRALAA